MNYLVQLSIGLFTIFSLFFYEVFTQASVSMEYKNINSYLNALHEQGKLNGNVLVRKKGITIYEKSFGYTINILTLNAAILDGLVLTTYI